LAGPPGEDSTQTRRSFQAALESEQATLKEHAQDTQKLQEATDQLLSASHALAELMYKQTSDAAASGAPASEHQKSDEPIDADIS
jgi:hypothetical protein